MPRKLRSSLCFMISINSANHGYLSSIFPMRLVAMIACGLSVSPVIGSSLEFSESERKVIAVDPEKSTGLDKVYVAYDVSRLSVSFTSKDIAIPVKWYRYDNLGASFSTPINNIEYDGTKSTLNDITPDSGYIIEEGDKRYYFWIVEYRGKEFKVDSFNPSQEQDCGITLLEFSGNASPITFFTINGRQEVLSRDISLDYLSLDFDSERRQFVQSEMNKSLQSISSTISLIPPVLCQTTFILSGDRFLKEWGDTKEVETAAFSPVAVDVRTEAEQSSSSDDDDSGSNQMKMDVDGLGGSAPCTISFNAYVSDAVIHKEWQMANDPDFEDITYRINDQDFEYTFTQEGTTYVRFVGSNSDGSCEAFGDVYTVTIGNSDLLIPNAFSPNGDGINDEWKVSYRSLLEFKCWIFDRQGHQVFETDDPSKGWDGKRGGKIVKPGVYYYVIQAKGSDGKRYKRSGDINILGTSNNRNTTQYE